MADISSFSGVSGSDLTEAQILGILERINLNIYNLLDNKHTIGFRQEHGTAGFQMDYGQALRELRELKKHYESLLSDVPELQVSIFDDPAR